MGRRVTGQVSNWDKVEYLSGPPALVLWPPTKNWIIRAGGQSNACTQDRIIFYGFVCVQDQTVSQLSCHVNGAIASSTVELGIYSPNNLDEPFTLLASTSVSSATTGFKTGNLNQNVSFQRGNKYFLAGMPTVGNVTLYGADANNMNYGFIGPMGQDNLPRGLVLHKIADVSGSLDSVVTSVFFSHFGVNRMNIGVGIVSAP
jgi:hypothetical protein